MPPACSQRRNESSQITEKTLPYILRSDPGSIFGVVTVILLAHQIHNLRRAARDAFEPFDVEDKRVISNLKGHEFCADEGFSPGFSENACCHALYV